MLVKAIVSGALAIVVFVLVFSPAMAQDKPWFDVKNCDFCKQFGKDPELLKNMIWEYHDISNGLMIITAVKPELKASYLAAQEGMEKVAQDMAQGKTVTYAESLKIIKGLDTLKKLAKTGQMDLYATSTGGVGSTFVIDSIKAVVTFSASD